MHLSRLAPVIPGRIFFPIALKKQSSASMRVVFIRLLYMKQFSRSSVLKNWLALSPD